VHEAAEVDAQEDEEGIAEEKDGIRFEEIDTEDFDELIN
jgi:hypothetical protein